MGLLRMIGWNKYFDAKKALVILERIRANVEKRCSEEDEKKQTKLEKDINADKKNLSSMIAKAKIQNERNLGKFAKAPNDAEKERYQCKKNVLADVIAMSEEVDKIRADEPNVTDIIKNIKTTFTTALNTLK
ncbi:MAG: hypothetical protein LBR79_03195 [Oscillospiraceae bacterium]|jgi:hypothetical protein|nr:hypothetical protein [Oscillospiraceae bacterium]